MTVREAADLVATAVDSNRISWQLVTRLASWRSLSPSEHPEKQALGEQRYMQAVEIFKAQHGGAEVAMFPPIGAVYLLGNGELRMTIDNSQIGFDWSSAWPLVFEIDAIADEAREWWQGENQPDEDSTERRPHSMRAYALATWVVGAIEQESTRHPSPHKYPLPPPSRTFRSSLANFNSEMDRMRERFDRAAQRTAQSRYWRGALAGAVALAVVSVALGALFYWRDVNAAYGVVVPAGGIGAMVSVLQRMSAGKLVIDREAGRDLIEVFGGFRPFIGAVFGLAIMALLAGGLVPAIEIPEDGQLAFYGAIGFLAGFNERWAQDMLKGSSDGLG